MYTCYVGTVLLTRQVYFACGKLFCNVSLKQISIMKKIIIKLEKANKSIDRDNGFVV